MSIPPNIRWEVHRVATSQKYMSSLIEIQTQWSLDDVCDAHAVLDAFERLDYLENKRHR